MALALILAILEACPLVGGVVRDGAIVEEFRVVGEKCWTMVVKKGETRVV